MTKISWIILQQESLTGLLMEQIRNSQEEMYSVKKLFTLPNLLKKFIKIQKSRFQKVWYLNVTNLVHISVLWGNARIIYKFTIGSTDFSGKTTKNTAYIKLPVVLLNIIAVLHQNDVSFMIEKNTGKYTTLGTAIRLLHRKQIWHI